MFKVTPKGVLFLLSYFPGYRIHLYIPATHFFMGFINSSFTAGSPLVQPVTVPPQSALSDGLIYIFYIPEMLPSHGNPLIWVLAP